MSRRAADPRSPVGNVRFALRVFFGFGATVGIGAALASGCGNGGIVAVYVSSDCPLDDEGNLAVPLECCPCPTPEDCKYFYWDKGLATPKIAESCCDQGWPDAVCGDGSKHGSNPRLCCTVAPAERCSGQCVERAPETWTGPELVYRGGGQDPPACPIEASDKTFEGWAKPKLEPLACPTCGCGEPKGTCKLPETWTVSSAACYQGGVKTNFDPPVGWDGTCNADKAIAEGKLCGSDPCVRSLTVSAPIIVEEPCEVLVDGAPPKDQEPPHVASPMQAALVSDPMNALPPPPEPIARACAPSEPWPACTNELDQACVPVHSPDFAVCIRKAGDVACPAGWPDRQVVYDNVDITQECSACSCSPSTGGFCLALARTYVDNTCGVLRGPFAVSTEQPEWCTDIAPIGTALAGKQSEVLNYTRGSCKPSGGEPIENVKLEGPTTFCCLAE